MNAAKIFLNRGQASPARHASRWCLAAVLNVLIGISVDLTICRAQQPNNDVQGAQVLTRGPVHEAFAGMVTFNPEPGIVVTKAPPDIIEELPPQERPEGDNVAWIPGYWAWDDERSDFLWISGTWRALPPGREWMAGYWGQTMQGYQWTSGYWADATARETTYLPPPPATVEMGPNIAAPSINYGWTPGCWIWYRGRYAWQPGYWAQGRSDWDWIPAHYVWTPRGYIFVGGFWDYPVERRGVLFAPMYFESGLYSRRGYSYSPTIVIDLGVFIDHLFLRPRYHHYYFGDYYAPSYSQGGFYSSFSFQASRSGYNPIYSHQRWEHRRDREWEHRVETSYQYRRDHEAARPPRTWAAQRNIGPSAAGPAQNRMLVATSIDQLAKRKDSPLRFQLVDSEERQKLARRGQEVQKSRDQRRTLEAKAMDTPARKPGGVFEPVKVKLPTSPIVAKPANRLRGNQAPPKAQRAPKPDPKFQPKSEAPGRSPNVNRSNPPVEPRKFEPEKKPTPGRSEAAPRERQVQPEPARRPEASPRPSQLQSPGSASVLGRQAQPRSKVPGRPPIVNRSNPQPEPERRPETSQRPGQGQSPRNVRVLGIQAQRMSAQPLIKMQAPVGKGAPKPLKDDRQKEGQGKPSPAENPPVR